MNKEYEDVKAYWNSVYAKLKPEKIAEKWIKEDSFNQLIQDYVAPRSTVLDYGCGAGWALFEILHTVDIACGVGLDTSENAIDYCNNCADMLGDERLQFVSGVEKVLDDLEQFYDTIVSFNVLDVVPDEVIHAILGEMKEHSKKDGYVIIGINPDYPREMLEKSGYVYKGNHLFKDDILRGNEKTEQEWIDLLEHYFRFVELRRVALTEREEKYPRRVFVLQN